MTIKKSLKGSVNLTAFGKKELARHMYFKGRQFLFAALLLNEKIGRNYVYLHLICQGLEISLKSALIYRDYDKYFPILATKYRHDLVKIYNDYLHVFDSKFNDEELLQELSFLNDFYKNNKLRYASSIDILVDSETIETERVIIFTTEIVGFLDKEFGIKNPSKNPLKEEKENPVKH